MALSLLLKGIIIGVAAIIPGVSGSVFAVITGVYDDIIYFSSGIAKNFKRSFLFLLPTVSGISVGVLLAANPVLEVCERFPLYSYCFFVGVMVASLIPAARKIKLLGKLKITEFLVAAICFGAVLLLRFVATKTGAGRFVSIPEIRNFWDFAALLFAGFISVGLMSLPGVSGSVLLLVLGQYGTVYKAAGSPARLLKALLEGEISSALSALKSIMLLIPFFIGAIMGFASFSKLIAYLLKSHTKAVYCAVFGFVLGSCLTLALDCVLPAAKGMNISGVFLAFLISAFTLSGALLTLCFSGDKKGDFGENSGRSDAA